MERVLAEELEVAQFRANLQSLVNEVVAFRKEAARTHESRQAPSPPTLLSFSPSPDDQVALAAHLDRAREQEYKAVLMKRAESLREDAESKSEECKKLRRDNEAQRIKLLAALDECEKEKTKRAVMSSLIDTLRANQDELGSQIKAMFEEKTDLEVTVKLAEESTRTSVLALQSMSEETAQLRASVGRGDAQYRKMAAARDALERDLAKTKAEAAKQARSLETAESGLEASQEQAAARTRDARQAELLAEVARSEAVSADERCSATTSALTTLSTEIEALRTSFDVERNANCEVMARLLSSEAESQGLVRTLRQSLDEEITLRKAVESERNSVVESFTTASRDKLEAERVAKQAANDLRVLNTKHDRLLAAQRAAHQHQQQQQIQSYQQQSQPPPPPPQQQHHQHFQQFQQQSHQQQQFQQQLPSSQLYQQQQQQQHRLGVGPTVIPSNAVQSRPLSCSSAGSGGSTGGFDYASPLPSAPDDLSGAASKPPEILLKRDSCPLCQEMAYGLMALCQSCTTPFHSLCLPPNKRTLGTKFICNNCEGTAPLSKV